MGMSIDELVRKEGWQVKYIGGERKIVAEGHEFPWTHPVAVHLKLYRDETNPDSKYRHMKAAHDYMWPDTIWHYWTEDRFREHCSAHTFIIYAAGASASKSYDAAKIALLFWFANPTGRNVTIASVTLESLKTRVWGYVTSLIDTKLREF